MIRIETRGTTIHGDTYSVVVEADVVAHAVADYRRVIGEVKYGDIVTKAETKK